MKINIENIFDEYDLNEIKEIDRRLKIYKHDYTMYLRLSVIKLVKQGCT